MLERCPERGKFNRGGFSWLGLDVCRGCRLVNRRHSVKTPKDLQAPQNTTNRQTLPRHFSRHSGSLISDWAGLFGNNRSLPPSLIKLPALAHLIESPLSYLRTRTTRSTPTTEYMHPPMSLTDDTAPSPQLSASLASSPAWWIRTVPRPTCTHPSILRTLRRHRRFTTISGWVPWVSPLLRSTSTRLLC